MLRFGRVTAIVLTIALMLSLCACGGVEKSKDVTSSLPALNDEPSSSSTPVSSEEPNSSSVPAVSSKPVVTSKPQSSSTVSKPQSVIVANDPNNDIDIEDNIFMDSMVYTGYNLAKHKADGLMWKYVLSKYKKGYGWLSKISYDYDGGTSGYETNAQGLPDIAYFEKHDLVCASYVTYVYFNYLPNVVGLDTSFLTKPTNPTLANDWYRCALDWVRKGYSYEIPFTASRSGGGEIKFKPSQNIPIGSIILCNDMNNKSSNWACHVSIYAGYKNGYHWVYHVGNDNGPEFCAMERFCYGPDPVWPLSVISPPVNMRFAAKADVVVKDENGAPVSGAKISLKAKSGRIFELGATNAEGVVTKDGFNYGDYTLTVTAPAGYTAETPTQTVKLTIDNNSLNTINVTLKKAS